MSVRDESRRYGRAAKAACALAMLLSILLPASGAVAAPAVDGLIVRLRDDGRRAALSASTDSSAAAVQLSMQRETIARGRLAVILGRVAAFAPGAVLERPVGSSAHLLRWRVAPDTAHLNAISHALMQQPDVLSVEADTLEPRLASSPNDPRYKDQQWLHQTSTSTSTSMASSSSPGGAASAAGGLPNLPAAWGRTTGSPVSGRAFIPVAVVDTGMLRNHPDLVDKWLPGYDFVSRVVSANDGDGRDADPSDPGDWVTAGDAAVGGVLAGCTVEDSSWHGTLIAGEIAASTNNGVGVAGINWEARIVPVRVGGRCGAQLSDIIDGMRWAAGFMVFDASGQPMPLNANPVRVINISFGGAMACGSLLQATIDELRQAGVAVVAAAGNASGAVSRPANCAGVIGVGALNALGFKAPYSNFGPEIAISTVGGDEDGDDACSRSVIDTGILSTRNTGVTGPESGRDDYGAVNGTSFAAPIVAGTISLMLAANSSLSVDQIVAGLKASARPHVAAARLPTCSSASPGRCACTTGTCGAGVLDASGAVSFAFDPVNYVAAAATSMVIGDARLAACSLADAAVSPAGLTAISASSDTSPAAAGGSGGGSIDATWLALLTAAIAALYRLPSSRLDAARGRTGASDNA